MIHLIHPISSRNISTLEKGTTLNWYLRAVNPRSAYILYFVTFSTYITFTFPCSSLFRTYTIAFLPLLFPKLPVFVR